MEKIKRLAVKFKPQILYLFFGGLTTLVNIICYYLAYNIFEVSNVTSTALAWVMAVIFAFVTNRIFVFQSKARGIKNILRETVSFFTCRFLTGVMDVAIMWFAVDIMLWDSLVWKMISNILVTILNYFASKIFVFKK